MITGVCEWEREETDEEKEMKSPRIYQMRVIQDIGCCTILREWRQCTAVLETDSSL